MLVQNGFVWWDDLKFVRRESSDENWNWLVLDIIVVQAFLVQFTGGSESLFYDSHFSFKALFCVGFVSTFQQNASKTRTLREKNHSAMSLYQYGTILYSYYYTSFDTSSSTFIKDKNVTLYVANVILYRSLRSYYTIIYWVHELRAIMMTKKPKIVTTRHHRKRLLIIKKAEEKYLLTTLTTAYIIKKIYE